MSNYFVVVYEGKADFVTATELADRILLREINWLDEDESLLDTQRQWIHDDPAGRPLQWISVANYAREAGIRVHGHFDGLPGEPDAQAARKAIAYVRETFDTFGAIILVRDVDKQIERRNGLEQARSIYSSACRIVLGMAIPKRESWVICGFDAEDDSERQQLQAETKKLGANPCLKSHELTAGHDEDVRSSKRVLSLLTDGNWERQRKCWQTTELDVLNERGQNNGLADYLNEIKEYLVPLITGHGNHSHQP